MPEQKPWGFINFLKSRNFGTLVRSLGALAIVTILFRFDFNSLEGALFDARVRYSLTPTISGDVVTVAVDPKTMATLNGEPDVVDNLGVLNQIVKQQPRAVVFLADPGAWVGNISQRMKFAQKASKVSNFFFATEKVAPASQHRRMKLAKPFDTLSFASAPITRDNITFAEDKVTRRILLSFEGQIFLQPVLAGLYNDVLDIDTYRGSYKYDDSVFTFIRFHPQGTYKPLSFIDVKNGKAESGAFTDKIVLVGIDNQLDTDDYVLTPYSKYPLAMSRLEVQANIIDTLILNDGIIKAPTWVNFAITFAMAMLTIFLVWTARPLYGILFLLAETAVFVVLAFFVFSFFGLWLSVIYPLIAVFISYYFFIPYRLIMENRKSWEYYQRNKILTQVEELKTNFLSMMSHDLRTPIARIQGMAETALNEPETLSQKQEEALSTIMRSTDELGRFIGSILDLSRIESKEVKLNKTSKDVNSLIKEVIRKYEFNAKAKNITIESQLDPLFSIKIDAELIRQVLTNLVENAIKYSPEGSTVAILSREEDGQIKVSIQDTGPGIPQDEMNNIFLKFYRSKNAKASTVKGSGLGLYLAKYFANLHGGNLTVQSAPRQGSTFTVELPVN